MTTETQAGEDERLRELDLDLEKLNLEGHWRLTNAAAPEPKPFAAPHLWEWKHIRSALLRAGEMRAIDGGAGRRTVRLCMPGLDAKWATPTIHASVQLVKPGEIAEAHRHTMAALRFVVEGSGGYTTVEGEKFPMADGDLILTPNWTWHDHGNEGDAPVIWIDGHDFPLVNHLRGQFVDRYNATRQEIRVAEGHTRLRTGAIRPAALRGHGPKAVPYLYKGAEARELLFGMDESERDPSGSYVLDYVNPLTGLYTLPSIACRLHRIPRGTQTRRRRTTPNAIFHVVEGKGQTVAGSRTLNWTKGDLFVIPGWTWHEHLPAGESDAVLFSIGDDPVYDALGLLRTELLQ